MKDKAKTREQFIKELTQLQKKVTELEAKAAQFNQTEELFRKKEERFGLALKASQDGMWEWNITTGEDYWSPQFKQLIGYQDDEIEASFKTWELMLHPDDRQHVLEILKEHIEKHGNFNQEFRLKTKRGDYRWYCSRGQALWDAEGKPIKVVGSIRDITDIKRLEMELKGSYKDLEEKVEKRTAELRAANKKLKKIINEQRQTEVELEKTKAFMDNMIDSSLDCIITADISGYLTRVNNFFLQMLGYEREEEVIGKHITEFGPKEGTNYESITGEVVYLSTQYFEDRKTMYEKFKQDGRISNWQVYLVTKSGKLVPVEHNLSFLYSEKGDPIATVGITRDITERRRAEEELKKSEEKYHNLIENANDAIISINTAGMVMGFNKRAEEMFGYSREEILGQSSTLLVAQQNRERQKKELKSFKEAGVAFDKDQNIFEGTGVRKDGKEFDVEFSFYIVEINGEIIATSSIRDISKRKVAEQKLIDYQERLKALTSQLTLSEEKERRRFSEYLHDEIGQYLFASQLQLEQLRTTLSSKENTETLENVLNNIRKVIDNSRSLTFELSSPILYELGLEKALEWLAEHTGRQYNITVVFEDDKQEKLIEDDMKIFLYQAVRELLTNVAKHAQTQKASVSVKKVNSKIQIYVEDNGVGFKPPHKHFSGDQIKGFGLFHINERLEELGGQLEIDSQPNRGTSITILAPLRTNGD